MIVATSCATRRAPDVAPNGGSAIGASSMPANEAPSVELTDPDAARPAGVSAVGLPPLAASSELVQLIVPDHRDAMVSVPVGATERRPLVLALHGNYDRPEWQCSVWRETMKGYPFVLCPRGVPRRDAPASADRWTYGKPADVRHEIEAALGAL